MHPEDHPADAIPVTVLLFAGLREQKGTDRIECSVAPGTTVDELYGSLFPSGPSGRLPVLFAMDQEYVSRSTPVRAGSEVALLPPLGGG